MKRRLNMAAGIIHRPRVVLMDEPTVGVDPQSRIRIFEMIEALSPQGPQSFTPRITWKRLSGSVIA
jgi:ABC-2 type transport system ATP-binding protein